MRKYASLQTRAALHRSILLTGLVSSLMLGSGSALAGTPSVYHSPADDGLAASTTPVEPGSPLVTLFLYVDAGPSPTSTGTACEDGDGDELCAWEFRLEASGAATIQAFLPDPGRNLETRVSTSEFAAVGGDAIGGQLGPIRVGALDLSVASTQWTVSVGDGSAVDAGFVLVPLSQSAIATPEPSSKALILAGLGLLVIFARRRRRCAHPPSRFIALASLALLVLPLAAEAQDADSDGIVDPLDNCMHTPNPSQADSGGLFGPSADGIGDACQCGDVTDDGEVDLLDLATYERGLANLLPTTLDEDKCSVVGGRTDCDPNDRQTLRQAIVGTGSGLGQVCQSANLVPPLPGRIAAVGDSITQGFGASCSCNTNFFCLLCLLGADQPQHSWFNGSSLPNSFYALYGGAGSGITSTRVSVSGAEMSTGSNSFSNQADDILALSPLPDLVVVELGGNDVCNRGCVDPGNCADPLYDDATWTAAVEAGLDKLVGFGHATSLTPEATIYLLGVPRVQDLYSAGVAKPAGASNIDCDAIRDDYDICEIATLNAPLNGEDLTTRLEGLAERIPRYNEILRDLALAYTTNTNGRNPSGIEVVSDYVNEALPSVGTTPFGAAEINGGDCFHPSVFGQSTAAAAAWYSNPR